MVWYAVEALDDAVDPVRSLLFPLDVGRWLKLAVIVLFLGGGGVTPPTAGGQSTVGGGEMAPDAGAMELPSETVIAAVVGLLVVILALVLLFTVLGSVMEFAFLESLRTREVHVRRYAGDNLGKGLRLFGFRIALYLVGLVPVVGLALLLFPGLATGSPTIVLGTVALFVPVIALFGFVVALVDGATTNFVVPVMLLRDEGPVAAWRTFWPTLVADWKQFAVYAVIRVVLAIAAGIVLSIVGGFLAVAVLVPFAVVGAAAVLAFGTPSALVSTAVGLGILVVLILAYVAVLFFVLSVVRVPIQAYLRYYALLVLGDVDADLDLIPDIREETRSHEPV